MSVVVWLFLLPPLVLTGGFAIEVLVGLVLRERNLPRASEVPRTVIVMPAQDESAIIEKIVRRARSELGVGMSLLVVADNCYDDTASIARAAGAAVIERTDPSRRGKGYALAFARDHLITAPPHCVIVLDADCETDRASLDHLAALAIATHRPVQGTYLLRPDPGHSPKVQVSTFAFLLKNLVRQRGLTILSGRALLTGAGMAMPWPLFETAPLATGDIVEDLSLGLDLLESGAPPLFTSHAITWSDASSDQGTLLQRTRWETGFIETARRRALPLLGKAMRKLDPGLAWFAFSLMIPPLGLLLLLDALAGSAALLLYFATGTASPVWVGAIVVASAFIAVSSAWWKLGRTYLTFSSALQLPIYVLWKIPLYLRALRRRPESWLRPGRRGDGE